MHLTLITGMPLFIDVRVHAPRTRGVAILDFRTQANGSYKFMRGKRRGYWRVLEVRDVKGPRNINSHNVIAVLYSGPGGIDGVTERSAYSLHESNREALHIVETFNEGIA